MTPTGYEYTFLSDKAIEFVLHALLKKLKLLWGSVFVEVGPDWSRYEFESWIDCIDVWPAGIELYFVSDRAGFEHIEENGITKNVNGIRLFLLEASGDSSISYKAKIVGHVDQDNTSFGEFDCELIGKLINRFTTIVPEESADSPGDIVCMMRDILQD